MKVIGISGLPGSGKSLISNMSKKKGAIVIKMGDVIRKEAKKRNEDSRITSVRLREEHGDYVVAKLTIKRIKKVMAKENNLDNKLILVEGIRSPYEVELFRENFKDFKVLSVFSSPKVRFKRLQLRKRSDDSDKFEEFKKRDQMELRFGIGEVIATSDYLIINEDELGKYKYDINTFLQRNMKK